MLKLFISYSHSDEHYVQDFLRHTALLEESGLLKERFYDRNITAGDDFWNRIEKHLEDRDIVCCFISAHYISSAACKKELNRALELREQKGVLVIPVILSHCQWELLPNVKRLLAMPTDGKSISSYSNEDEGWYVVANMLKDASEKHIKLKTLSFSDSHTAFLEDASLLTKAHGNKEELKMSDIYIHPEVEKKVNGSGKSRVSFEKLVSDFRYGDKLAIVGDDQSGKTTAAKKLCTMLRGKGFIPVYLKDEAEVLQGDLQTRVSRLFKEQYNTEHEFSDYDVKRCVPIIDDFHKAKHKETVIEKMKVFEQIIIIVDSIFDIDLLQEKTVVDFDRYTIKQLKPSLRNELIRKWINVAETECSDPEFINSDYMQIDERMRTVDEALGKVLGKGIMPAYPFFILTLLSNYDSIGKPLNEEITSQGYCYQALIVLFLSKEGVKSDNLDTYINFLTEFAHERHLHKSPLSQESFKDFLNRYKDEFNLTEKSDVLIKRFSSSGILKVSSLGNYDFNYPYVYYFFAGKYYAEHLDDRDDDNKTALGELDLILDKLHKNENAYIAIFIVHHSKDKSLITKILTRADCLFKDYQPATMSKDEMAFFKVEPVRRVAISQENKPNEARSQELQIRDKIEEQAQNESELDEDEEFGNELSIELRRSMKTVEVIGRILSNRAGSIKKEQLSDIFERGMNVHLRLMNSFFELVKRMIVMPNYNDFIKERILEEYPDLKEDELEERAQKFFWGVNFGFIVGMVKKISITLGSKKNIKISDAVCSNDMTPVKFLIRQDIAMRHAKNIRLDEIDEVEKLDMPIVARNAFAFSIAQFCRYNKITDADRSELMKFGIKKQFLLPRADLKE